MQFLNGNKCLSFKHPTKLHSCVTLQSDFFLFLFTHFHHQSLPCGSAGKESTCSAKTWVQSWVGKIPRRRERLPTPVFWPREFHGLYSPWGRKELDTTDQLTHTLVAQTVKHLPAMWETRVRSVGREDSPGEGNGNPLRTPAWKIPWTEEPGRLQSKRSQTVRHN